VFAGYGLENRKRLQEIQKKYDPDGIFAPPSTRIL
jgi:hypothetical protein